jgi:hypothetical protein
MSFLGKHHTPETLEKMRNSTPREVRSTRVSGEKNPMFGRKHSEETKEKIRKSRIGKYSGKNSPLYGKPKSKDHCKKISEAKIKNYVKEKHPNFGKHHPPKTLEKMRNVKLGKKASEETIKKLSGENASAWKGGTSFMPYCPKFNKKRKKAVREFFNNLCICTGEPSYDKELSVHHIDHDKEQGCNGKPFNLIPLNSEHHAKEGWNQEEYKAYINKTLREGFKWGIWNKQEYMDKVMY